MILAIDIGNSNIVFGLYNHNEWTHQWREKTKLDYSSIFYALSIQNYLIENNFDVGNIENIIISSVVPDLTVTLSNTSKKLFQISPFIIDAESFIKLGINIEKPLEIGSDLVANAVAAYDRFKDYAIAVDFGTALTFTTVDNKGNILGVSIAPGLKTAINSLTDKTAKLPPVPLEMPATVIGKNTIHAIQAGTLMGYYGLAEKVISLINNEIGVKCKVIATGGLSSVIEPLNESFDIIDKNLTLEGMRMIYEQVGK